MTAKVKEYVEKERRKFAANPHDLGVDPKGETTFNENALFGPAYRGWNTLLELLIDKLRSTKTNTEFLNEIAKAPSGMGT